MQTLNYRQVAAARCHIESESYAVFDMKRPVGQEPLDYVKMTIVGRTIQRARPTNLVSVCAQPLHHIEMAAFCSEINCIDALNIAYVFVQPLHHVEMAIACRSTNCTVCTPVCAIFMQPFNDMQMTMRGRDIHHQRRQIHSYLIS